MIFYEKETYIGLAMASLPALASLYFFFIKADRRKGIGFLLLTALLLRLLMISVDPYIQAWDERFHGLVAKNMMAHPFKPMLNAHPILPYDLKDWANNHIWVHKQPVFLWQMALSMKIFGVNTFVLRLPSAVLGVLMVLMIYDIGRKWLKNEQAAYCAAFLSAFSYYTLELTSGLRSLEHNDLVFTVYVTATCWAFVNYIHSQFNWKWALWVGVFAGLAILNKWLVGLLIFGGWGMYLLLSLPQFEFKKYWHYVFALATACILFLPWQFYIQHAFPLESAASYASNRRHMVSDLGHPGSNWYHLLFLPIAYHFLLLVFLLIGLIKIFSVKIIDRKLSIAFVSMIVVLFAFFSILVPTRMPAFVFPVSGLIFLLMGYGALLSWDWIRLRSKYLVQNTNTFLILFFLILGFCALKPGLIAKHRNQQNAERNAKIHNMRIYKNLDDKMLEDRIVFNCKTYENLELMFYKNASAYFAYPTEKVVDSLQNQGYKLAAFNFAKTPLPDYIVRDSEIIILDRDIW